MVSVSLNSGIWSFLELKSSRLISCRFQNAVKFNTDLSYHRSFVTCTCLVTLMSCIIEHHGTLKGFFLTSREILGTSSNAKSWSRKRWRMIQAMWYNFLLVARQNVPIKFILTDFTLDSWKDFDGSLSWLPHKKWYRSPVSTTYDFHILRTVASVRYFLEMVKNNIANQVYSFWQYVTLINREISCLMNSLMLLFFLFVKYDKKFICLRRENLFSTKYFLHLCCRLSLY